MNLPRLYHSANKAQRFDAKEIIDEYFPHFQWRSNGGDTLIDIGTGTGDVLIDFILPRMPKDFREVIGADISETMVNYAQNTHGTDDRCDFRMLNIESESGVTNDLRGRFDHVTSFYCLHWIRNQRQAFQNIYDLLSSKGGDCILLYLAWMPIYDVLYKLRESPKWFQYMQDMETFTCPLHNISDREGYLLEILKDVHFAEYEVEIRDKVHIYETENIFKDNMKAVNPYLQRIPLELHQEYMDDFVKISIELGLSEQQDNGKDIMFPLPYKLAVVYAKKFECTAN